MSNLLKNTVLPNSDIDIKLSRKGYIVTFDSYKYYPCKCSTCNKKDVPPDHFPCLLCCHNYDYVTGYLDNFYYEKH